jgi:hypothetical protein
LFQPPGTMVRERDIKILDYGMRVIFHNDFRFRAAF